MMRIFIFLSCCLFLFCQQQGKMSTTPVVDPNNTSDMALLMRDMFSKLDEIKHLIEKGEDISNEQLDFKLIHKETPTDSSFIKSNFEYMSNSYSNSVQIFNNSPSSKTFTSIVNNCMSCHTKMCPGPLNSISKLELEK